MKKIVVLAALVLVGFVLSAPLPLQSAFQPEAFTAANFKLTGGIVVLSSPTLADLNGDDVPEVLIGTTACRGNTSGTCTYNQATVLVVSRGDGTVLWSKVMNAPINSSPAVGDINDDGYPEVVVALGGDVSDMDNHGGVVAFDRNGNQLWIFYTQDQYPADGYRDGVISSPTLCDVDGDGDMEIAFGGWDQRIYLLDHNGNSLWANLPGSYVGPGYLNADSIWSTAACADLNRDGNAEIIIGADITGNGVLPDGTHTQNGGFLYIFDKSGNVLVRYFVPETIYASPAVGDLDGDGDLEIVSGTGWYWWNAQGQSGQPYVYAFDTSQVFNASLSYADPAKLPSLSGWPQPTSYPGYSSPALADLDGDGDLEIVIGTGHPTLNTDGMPGAGMVYAWHHTGAAVSGWPVYPLNAQGKDSRIFSSPAIADVDADGGLEVLFSMLWDVQVYNANGSFQERLGTYWTVDSSPAVGDADGDGYPEVWVGSSNVWDDPAYGYLWRFESQTQALGATPWPMFHHDAQHTGRYSLPPQLSTTDSILVLHEYGDARNEKASLIIKNAGEQSFDWVATPPSGVSLSSMSGSLTTQTVLSVDTYPSSHAVGTHNFGNIEIHASMGGSAIAGSPAYVPVRLKVVSHLYRIFLPAIKK